MRKKLKCMCCGKEKPPVQGFYATYSNMYKYLYEDRNGRMLVCKECFADMYLELLKKYGTDIKALYHLCMMFDICFDIKTVESCRDRDSVVRDELGLLKSYMKDINSLKQSKGKTSLDTTHIVMDDESIKEVEDRYKSLIEDLENNNIQEKSMPIIDYERKKITKEIRRKWGSEYTEDECVLLEDYYEYYFDTYNHDNDPTKLDHIREVCTFKLIIADAKKSKPINYNLIEKFHNLIRQTLNSAGLSPSQKKGIGESHDEIFGKKIYIYETENPIPEVQEDLKDVDKFWKYIVRYIIKPLAVVKGFAKGVYSIDDGDKVELNKELLDHLGKEVGDE